MKIRKWLEAILLDQKADEKMLRLKEIPVDEMQDYCIEAIEYLEGKLERYREWFKNYEVSLRPELVACEKRKEETVYYWTLYFLWKKKYMIYSAGNYITVRFKLGVYKKNEKKAYVTENYQEIFDEFVVENLKNASEEAKDEKLMQKHVKTTEVAPEEKGHVMINW